VSSGAAEAERQMQSSGAGEEGKVFVSAQWRPSLVEAVVEHRGALPIAQNIPMSARTPVTDAVIVI
jgi:hypothetical protein